MTAPPEWGDAQLVAGLQAGDSTCLAAAYDRYADRIHDFCLGMLRDREDAADAVQDTFVLVHRRIGQLRDPQRLRPWIYAIARSVALARLRSRDRVRPTDAVADTPDPAAGPDRLAEQEALRRLLADATEGLSATDRAMLRLHLHGLEGAELGAAMGMSAANAHVRLSRLRDQVERSLGALLVARTGRRDCPDLTAVLGGWDGRITPLLRKRIARHVERCARCAQRRNAAVSPRALLSGLVVVAAPAALRERVLDEVELVAHDTATNHTATDHTATDHTATDHTATDHTATDHTATERTAPGGTAVDRAARPRSGRPASHRARTRGVRAAAAVLIGLVLVAGAVVVAGMPDPGTRSVAAPARPGAADAAPAAPASPSAAEVPTPTPDALTTGAVPAERTAPDPVGSSPPTARRPPPSPAEAPRPRPEPPRIVGQDASPVALELRGCPADRAGVRVRLAEGTPASAATLFWTGAGGSGSTPMQGSGTTWSGTLGPFAETGTVTWWVNVSNGSASTTGARQTVSVTGCRDARPSIGASEVRPRR